MSDLAAITFDFLKSFLIGLGDLESLNLLLPLFRSQPRRKDKDQLFGVKNSEVDILDCVHT